MQISKTYFFLPGGVKNLNAINAILVYKKPISLWALFFLSAISFLTTLNLPYQGEEAVYTLTSLEMWLQKEWFIPTLFGNEYGRPPLFNWLIIPLSIQLGWENMLLSSRLVTMMATFSTTFLLFIFTEKLFRNRMLTLFTLCIYLSGDLLIRRGWLAYADPLFSFFVFLAIVSVWFALENNKKYWFLCAFLGLVGSYLTKAFTGYIFYAVTLFVLGTHHKNRKLLRSMFSVITHSGAVLFLCLWDYGFAMGAHNENMLCDIITKCRGGNGLQYGIKILTFPLEMLYRWLPCTFVLLFFGARYFWKHSNAKFLTLPMSITLPTLPTLTLLKSQYAKLNSSIKCVFGIFLLNFLIYWFAPESKIRYILPLYPLLAILFAYGIYRSSNDKVKFTIALLWAVVIVKYALGMVIYPYYEKANQRNYKEAAKDILKIVANNTLYTNDVTATGLSVAAEINILKLPDKPLQRPLHLKEISKGYLLSHTPTLYAIETELVKTYAFGSRKMYLLQLTR